MSKYQNIVLAVVNPDRESGKTTAAINLNTAMRQRGFNTLLIDLDPDANLSKSFAHFHHRPELTISDAIFNNNIIGSPIKLPKTSGGVHFIPAGSYLGQIDQDITNFKLYSDRLKSLMASFGTEYNFFIIDTPSKLGVLAALAMSASTHFIIPIRTLSDSVAMVKETTKVWSVLRDNLGENTDFLGAFYSQYDPDDRYYRNSETKINENLVGHLFKTKIVKTSYSQQRLEGYLNLSIEIIRSL